MFWQMNTKYQFLIAVIVLTGCITLALVTKLIKLHNYVMVVENALQTTDNKCRDLMKQSQEDIKHRHSVWQVYQDSRHEILLYSAFYDDRDILAPQTWIRVWAVARKSNVLYCQIWYDAVSKPYITKAVVNKTGRGEKLNGTSYGQYVYSCELPFNDVIIIPAFVSITPSPCQMTSLLIPVQVPTKAQEHDFGICVTISYGSIPATDIIEWFELNQILGVTEFNVYNGSMVGELRAVFSYYESQGLLTYSQLPPIINEHHRKAIQLNNDVSLNDCMYRNLYKYGYMVVIDFDEVITPRQHDTIPDMIEYLTSTSPGNTSSAFTFPQAWFFKHLAQDETQPTYLHTLRLRHRTSPSRSAMKTITDPRHCLSMSNHRCYNALRSYTKMVVSPKIGLSHHYRACSKSPKECAKLSESSHVDDTILKNKDVLDRRVSSVIETLRMNGVSLNGNKMK